MEEHEDGETTAGSAQLPAVDDVQRVETERVGGGNAGTGENSPGSGAFAGLAAEGGGVHVFRMETNFAADLPRAPVLATWICLIAAWVFLGSKVPFTVLLGVPLDMAALFLALVCLTRGALITGLVVMGLGTAGSLFVYLVGLFRFLAMV